MPTLNEQVILDAVGGLRVSRTAIERQSRLGQGVVYNTLGNMVRRGLLDKHSDDTYSLARRKAAKPEPVKRACKDPNRKAGDRWVKCRRDEPNQIEIIYDTIRQSSRALTYDDITVITGIKRTSVTPTVSRLRAEGKIRPERNLTRNNAYVATGI